MESESNFSGVVCLISSRFIFNIRLCFATLRARSQMNESLFCVRVTASVCVRSKKPCIILHPIPPASATSVYFSEHSFAVQEFNGRHAVPAQFLQISPPAQLRHRRPLVTHRRSHSRCAARPQRVFAFPQDVVSQASKASPVMSNYHINNFPPQ